MLATKLKDHTEWDNRMVEKLVEQNSLVDGQ